MHRHLNMFSLIGKSILSSISSSFLLRNNVVNACSKVHTSAVLQDQSDNKKRGPRGFLGYNKKIYPPQTENEKPRLAVIKFRSRLIFKYIFIVIFKFARSLFVTRRRTSNTVLRRCGILPVW